jgi:hypothetical protein
MEIVMTMAMSNDDDDSMALEYSDGALVMHRVQPRDFEVFKRTGHIVSIDAARFRLQDLPHFVIAVWSVLPPAARDEFLNRVSKEWRASLGRSPFIDPAKQDNTAARVEGGGEAGELA